MQKEFNTCCLHHTDDDDEEDGACGHTGVSGNPHTMTNPGASSIWDIQQFIITCYADFVWERLQNQHKMASLQPDRNTHFSEKCY